MSGGTSRRRTRDERALLRRLELRAFDLLAVGLGRLREALPLAGVLSLARVGGSLACAGALTSVRAHAVTLCILSRETRRSDSACKKQRCGGGSESGTGDDVKF